MRLQRRIDSLLAQRASEWHQALESADDAGRAEFVAWLKESPLHVREYLETVYTDRVLNHLDPQRLEDVDALIAQASPNVVPLEGKGIEPASSAIRRRRRLPLAAAAAVAAICLCAALLLSGRLSSATEYSTAVGEQRTIQLADSSRITINADSRLKVVMDGRRRDVELLRGEALFEVARDARRPFRVSTGTAIVQVMGTQFNVYERPSGTQVSVLEGRVTVMPQRAGDAISTAAGSASESLAAGQEAQVRPDGTIERSAKADVTKAVAWRERRLIFEEAPLEEMVREFNRYNRTVRLTLDGVRPGSHHYNGIFDAADPQSLADLLSKEPDLRVDRREAEIVISER